MAKVVRLPRGWSCAESDRVRVAQFAYDVEVNEETMGTDAAFFVTCRQHGLTLQEGLDYMSCIPDHDHPDSEWWKVLEGGE